LIGFVNTHSFFIEITPEWAVAHPGMVCNS
jgi:hypothetical protein